MPIKLITFDLDNTLWDVDSVIRAAEKDMVAWLEANVPESLDHYHVDNLMTLRQAVAKQFPDKVHDLSHMRRQVLFEVMKLTGLNARDAKKHAHLAFDVFFEGRNRVSFFPGAIETLERLASEFTLFALTNGNADIEKAGVSSFFRDAINSADVGASKPDPKMFHEALRRQRLAADSAVHIGDHLVDDIQGAINAGMYSVWVNFSGERPDSDATQPHREVADLPELIDAIADLNRPGDP